MRCRQLFLLFFVTLAFASSAFGAWADRGKEKDRANPLFQESLFVSGRAGFGSATLIGFNVGMDQPLWKLTGDTAHKYVSFGPRLSVLFGDSGVFGDIDVFVKGQLPIDVPHGFLAAQLMVPIGFSVEGYGRRSAVGLNLGVMPGLQYYFNRHIGLYYNMGFDYHGINKDSGFQHFLNGVFELGFAYAF
jgi:hypothetical protein